jgi:flagellar assembly factor FliW
MPSNPQNMTANLKAPLVFNLKNRRGKQLILNNPAYTTRHNVMEELKRRAAEIDAAQAQQAIEKAKAEAKVEAAASLKEAVGSTKPAKGKSTKKR